MSAYQTITVAADGSATVTDARTVDACAAERLRYLRGWCEVQILEVAPEHTQRNAALGLLPEPERLELVAAIQALRARYHAAAAAVAAIVAANAADPGVVGRADACDAIDLVQL